MQHFYNVGSLLLYGWLNRLNLKTLGKPVSKAILQSQVGLV